jgi:hypothetical protein
MCLLTSAGCEKRRRPDRYLFPAGYVGWVETTFGAPSAPALPIEDRFFLIRVPENGRVQTSTLMEYGWAKDEYYYEDDGRRQALRSTGWGQGGMIWAGEIGSTGGRGTERFFVGTEAQWKRHQTRYMGNLHRNVQ